MSAIVTRTLHGATDKVLRLTGNEALRGLDIGTDWNELCLGVRFRARTNTSLSANATFAAGLAAGTVHGYSDEAAGHTIGFRTKFPSGAGLYNSGDYWWAAVTGPNYGTLFKKVDGVLTDIANTGISGAYGCRFWAGKADGTSPIDSGWFVLVSKGETYWKVGAGFMCATGAGGEGSYYGVEPMTSAWMIAGLETGSIASLTSYLEATQAGHSYSTGWDLFHQDDVAVDEETDGEFDSVFLHWNHITTEVEVSEVAVAKWS